MKAALILTGMAVNLGSAVLAQNACPVAADLRGGIRIAFEDGSAEIYRDDGEGMVTVEGYEAGAYSYLMYLERGLYLRMFAGAADGVAQSDAMTVYDYGADLRDLTLPGPGGRWAGAVTVRDPEGATRQEPQSHVWGPLEKVDIGGCTYDMIEVQIAYKTSDDYLESVEYLPELGLSYMIWNQSQTMDRIPVRPVAISAEKK